VTVFSPWLVGLNSTSVRILARPDLYNLLLPEIIEQDKKTGHITFLDHWDEPDADIEVWDDDNPIVAFWDRSGYVPVYQSLFWVLEEEDYQDLIELNDLKQLRDPDLCPAKFLPMMAESLGHPLEEGLSEKKQRETVKAIVSLNKIRGKEISWVAFYRMTGFKVVPWPLWKKDIHEAQDRYARSRYPVVVAVAGEALATIPSGTLAVPPVRPTSFRATDGVETFRDDGEGNLLGNQGGTGTITYLTGAYTINFAAPPAGPVTADYDKVVDEYPYHAARADLDFYLIPIAGPPAPVVDASFVRSILSRWDEVRPIHVLLRHLTLVYEDTDYVDNFANDEPQVSPDAMGIDLHTAKTDFYAADLGPVSEEDWLHIVRSDGFQYLFIEDQAAIVWPADDTMFITSTPAQPHDGVW